MRIHLALGAALFILAAAPAAAQAVKIGYVNTIRIESESAPAKRAAVAIEQAFAPRQKEIATLRKRIAALQDKLAKEGGTMPPAEQQAGQRSLAEMMKQSDQMSRAFAEDLELRKNQERARVTEEANIAIKAVADAGHYDLILQQAAYSSPGIDITDQVLKGMAKGAGSQ